MKGTNSLSAESFIKGYSHPRKAELASKLLEGASYDELKEAGFGRINVLEMAREIKNGVEGKEDFNIEVPEENEAASSTSAPAEKKSDQGSSADAGTESAGSTTKNGSDGSNSNDKDAEKRDGGAHDTETLGGHEQTVKTGEEDAETLARREKEEADAKAAADAAGGATL